MGDLEKQERVETNGCEGGGEEEKLLVGEKVAVLDFEMLCSTVALQTQGKWRKLENGEDFCEEGDEFGGVLRMWEGELFDCLEDRRIAIESVCCPCHRFAKNMRLAGFGPFLHGVVYFVLAISALLNGIAFIVTERHYFLYLAFAFSISLGTYLGFFRTRIRKKFNIRTGDSSFDDCVCHLICPCCTLSQESRTLQMNNVQDGTWHGRSETIYIGSYGEGSSKSFIKSHPPLPISTKSLEPCTPLKVADGANSS